MRVLSKVVLVSIVLAIAMIAISTSAFQRRFAMSGPASKAELERGRYWLNRWPNARNATRHVSQMANWTQRHGCGEHRFGSSQSLPFRTGGPRPGAGRVAESYRGPGGESIGGWYRTEWRRLASPMQIYHMAPADARAIVAYLKSLPAEVH